MNVAYTLAQRLVQRLRSRESCSNPGCRARKPVRETLSCALLVLLFTSSYVSGSPAQPYPAKPLRLIEPYAAGGGLDIVLRPIATLLGQELGQPVVVDYRPGAGTLVGMQTCAKAAPDGYTVCVTTPESLTFNPLLFNKLPYDADNDFAPVALLTRGRGGVIVASAATPGKTLAEVMAYAKANPGKLNYGTWGPGSLPAVYLEWVAKQNGVAMVAVPYKGAGPVIPAIVVGQVQLTFTGIQLVMAHIKSGALKLLAVTGAQRSPMLPGVPSLGELNSDPGLDSYYGMFAPAKTPAAIIERISSEYSRAIHDEKLQEFMRSQFTELAGMGPAEFAEFLKKDRANAARIFKSLGITPGDAPG